MTKEEETKRVPSLDEVMVSSEPLQTVDIDVGEGVGFTISYRVMSWLDKSDCVAQATELFLNDKGQPQSMFHIDVYFREALKKMIVDFPYPVSDKVLNGLTSAIGNQLQEIIPAPLGESDANLAKGSEKPSKGRRKTRSSSATQ